ncbi:MAG: VWA domain-containing protein [Paracoccaceae bacterium]
MAQQLHEEAEPNDKPALAAELFGSVAIRGQFSDGDGQDAFVWTVPADLSAAPWTLNIDGLEESATLVWFFQLEYGDDDRAEVLNVENLARFGAKPLEKTKTIDGLLFPAGEYLLGVTPLGGLNFAEGLPSGSSAAALARIGTAEEATDEEGIYPFGSDTYDISLVAGEVLRWDDPTRVEDDIALFETRGGLNGETNASEAEIRFSVGAEQAEQLIRIEGQGEIGAQLSYSLERDDGQVLKSERLSGRQSFDIKHLVLAEGDYTLRLVSGRKDIGRFQIEMSASGVAVDGTEAEPNDSLDLANAIKIEDGVNGLGDRDYFSFQLSETDAENVRDLVLDVEEGGNASLCLSDEQNSSVQCVKGSGRVSLPNLHLSDGAYSIEVRAESERPYTLSFVDVPIAKKRFEREPNDYARHAHDIGTSKAVRGTFDRSGDYDYIRFDVEEPDLAYRIAVSGARQALLIDDLGQSLVERRSAVDGEFVFDNLDLLPGKYLLRLTGDVGTDYRVIVRNLGEIPADFEREPNDVLENALRLDFGEKRRGILGGGDAADSYVFSLAGPDTVRLSVEAPEDQSLTVYLYRAHVKSSAEAQVASRERVEPGKSLDFVTDLHPGFYRLSLVPNEAILAASPYSVSVDFAEHDTSLTDHEPNDWLGEARLVPPGGQVIGDASGMGGYDYYVSDAPSSGVLVHSCSSTTLMYAGFSKDANAPPDWETSRQFLAHEVPAEANDRYVYYFNGTPYECRLRHDSGVDIGGLGRQQLSVEEAETGTSVGQSTRLDLVFEDYGQRIPVGLPADEEFVRVSCAAVNPENEPKWDLNGGLGGQYTQTIGMASYVPLDTQASERSVLISYSNSDIYPAKAQCDVILGSDFASWPKAEDSPAWMIGEITLDNLSGEAWSDKAQKIAGSVSISNPGTSVTTVSLEAQASGKAWRVEGLPETVNLPPNTSQDLPFEIVIPSHASALFPARVRVTATQDDFSARSYSDVVRLDPNTAAVNPFSGFETPVALLGGIDVLNLHIGAMVVSEDGAEMAGDAFSAMADGRSPVVPTGKLPQETVFRLAGERPPIRGLGFSLRLDSSPTYWAKHILVEFSLDGETWTNAINVELEQRAERQFIVFDDPVVSQYLRITIRSQFADIAHRELSEVLAIAEPGYVPLASEIDLAAPEFGGHLVAGELPTAYAMLVTNKDREVWLDESDPESGFLEKHWIMGFHESRIARIAGFEWVPGEGRERDNQASEIKVSVANDLLGPFRPITTLTGFDRRQLEAPVFARFVKFTLPNQGLYLPKHIRIFEAPSSENYLSVFGQWTEDNSNGPFEHFEHAPPNSALVDLGGESMDTATSFALGQDVAANVAHSAPRWFEFEVPTEASGAIEFAMDGGPRLRQTGLRLFDALENEVALRRARVKKPDEESFGVFAAPRSDAMIYEADLTPGQTYFLVVDVPSRVLSLRAESVAGVSARRVGILRSLAEIARGFGENDAMRLLRKTVYADGDGLVVGKRRILKALQSRPVEAIGTSSFADAITHTAENFVDIDGAKAMVGFATGAIFNNQDDLQFADRLQRTPVNFQSVLLSCNGLQGCPDERVASDFMRSAAVGSRGRFQRAYQIDDIEDVIASAVAGLSKPVPYRLSSRLGLPSQVIETIESDHAELLVLSDETSGPSDLETAISIVLDASGSMLKRMPKSDKRRIEVARESLSELVTEVLPEGAMVSYRAFGLEKDACDTRAFLPLSPLDKAQAIVAIAETAAINLAKTPIAASLAAAADDLANHQGPKTVVLITDGKETCDGDVLAAIDKLRADGLEATLQIVGFAIDDEALKAEFTGWAERGGGVYIDAADQDGLSSAVKTAARGDYVVTDADGSRIALGVYNEPLVLPVGLVFAELCDGESVTELELAAGERSTISADHECEQ